MFNDILEYRVCIKNTELDKKFNEYYIFKDYNTYAIDNKNKCLCLGYVLALSKDKKWNIFPENSENTNYSVSGENINQMLNFIKAHENEGVDLINKFI